jgi:hypothetical protein
MFENEPVVSYVHGVAVTAFVSGNAYSAHFQADFTIDNIVYRVSFSNNMED